ncbi:hypothetical protein J7L67_01225 [bacterium]|nr:hypothetical protein [bacterium]
MSRIIVIGGIESTYKNAQILYELNEDIAMFYTRGEKSPGWEGVDMVDESKFAFADKVHRTIVRNSINDHIETIKSLKPDYIWSLGWQQMYKKELLDICPVIGIHESLLPEGAGAVPIANALLHDRPKTGITLFELDEGMDTGMIIGQLAGKLDPRQSTSTELYEEAMYLEEKIIRLFVPLLNEGIAPRIPQDFSKRTVYGKINWSDWTEEKIKRARVYPYV